MPSSDPLYLPYHQQVRDVVEKVRAEDCCTDCLISVLAHPELHAWFEDDAEDGPLFSGETHARLYAEMFAKYGDPGAAWLHILGSLRGLLGPGRPVGPDIDAEPVSEAGLVEIIKTIRAHHPRVDLAGGLAHMSKDSADVLAPILKLLEPREEHQARPKPTINRARTKNSRQVLEDWQRSSSSALGSTSAAPVLRLEDGQALSNALDLQHVIEVGRTQATQYPRDFEDPKRLEHWLLRFRWSVLNKFLPTFQTQPDDVIGPLARAVTSALFNHREVADSHTGHDDPELILWRNHHRVPPALAAELAPYLAELLSRLDRREKDEQLLWMCWRYATWAHGEKPDGLDPTVRRRLKQMACDELGRLRTLARQADSAEAKDRFMKRYGAFSYYDDLLMYVCTFGGIWDALKPLVLALRAMKVPCVSADLRTWNEPGLEQVSVWSQIPNWAGGVVHGHAGREENLDPRLEVLRREFAAFCLERLKTSQEGGPLEPSAAWRHGYIRAVRDLRVNPRGRGHHVLHHARKHDPDPAVRAAAEEAYTEMRHQEDLPENRSSRRAVLGALWWLRRAHFIELRGEAALDHRGSIRTRNRESRRTE